MACRRARPRDGGTACATCGDSLLDLETATDREIVRVALDAPSGVVLLGVVIGALAMYAVPAWLQLEDGGAIVLAQILAVVLVSACALGAIAARRSRYGLRARDVLGDDDLASRRDTWIRVLTGIPLAVSLACIAIHVAAPRASRGAARSPRSRSRGPSSATARRPCTS